MQKLIKITLTCLLFTLSTCHATTVSITADSGVVTPSEGAVTPSWPPIWWPGGG